MKILLAASEMEPYASAGAFGSHVAQLATGLAAQGHEVSVVLPFYRSARERLGSRLRKTNTRFSVPIGSQRFSCSVREAKTPDGVQIFFIERDEFFDRSGLYGTEEGDYQDNAERFIFFSKCVVELARRMDPAPEIIHSFNWQTALVPVLAADQRLPARIVLSTYSLEYQGNFWSYDFGLTNLPGSYFSARGLEYFGSMNLLKAGILFAERIVLPGARFVSTVQVDGHGCGLEPVLREHSWKLEGVPDGIEDSSWNPATDSFLSAPFTSASGRSGNRAAWLSAAGLQDGRDILLVHAGAMTGDGMAILLPALDRLFEAGCRIAILGKVAPHHLARMEFARRQHAGRLAWIPDPDEKTLHLALAGSDTLLAPAEIEPSTSILRRALRYGVIPIALDCGGLASIAPPCRSAGESGISFTFHLPTPEALVDAVRAAARIRANPSVWTGLVDRAMSIDTSWAATAASMEAVYASLLSQGSKAA